MADAVYIHIPFCANRCYYCDFQTYVTRNPQVVWDYLRSLEKEISNYSLGEIQTLYVGGGTPTFLEHRQMEFLLSVLDQAFPKRGENLEFTMEANPGTTDLSKLRLMKEGGVNRLSYGVQSFDDGLLGKIGRIHNRRQAFTAIEEARQAGITNLSIDLMFGLPEQTIEQFNESLTHALKLDIPHISAYSLKIEENTVFSKWEQKGRLSLPDEDTEIKMYELLIRKTEEQGYHWYEISNFAKHGFESRHNQVYWENKEYYGFGAGAHGYIHGHRYANYGSALKYSKEMVLNGDAVEESHPLSAMEQMEDYMILGLRLRRGVSSDDFYRRYQKKMTDVFADSIKKYIEEDLLAWDGDRLYLTKRGVFLGNEVFAGFL